MNPALSTTDRLVQEVNFDQQALTDFIVNSSRVVTTIAARRDDLSSLVSNANATAGAIAQENTALGQSIDLLPTTLRRGNTTFVNLRSTLDDLDVLVNASKPATKRLAPLLRQQNIHARLHHEPSQYPGADRGKTRQQDPEQRFHGVNVIPGAASALDANGK